MGSFDSTCAITRVAIHWGDPIYIIGWEPYVSSFEDNPRLGIKKVVEPDRSTYELVSVTYSKGGSAYDKIRSGNIHLYHGIYNDYGWIEEEPRPQYLEGGDWQAKVCFLHEEVVREICHRKGMDIEKQEYDPLRMVYIIADFAYCTRTPLFVPNWLLGQQYAGKEEWELQTQLVDMMGRVLTKKMEGD